MIADERVRGQRDLLSRRYLPEWRILRETTIFVLIFPAIRVFMSVRLLCGIGCVGVPCGRVGQCYTLERI